MTLAQKLQLRSGRVRVLDAPAELSAPLAEVAGDGPGVLAFVRTSADVTRHADALAAAAAGANGLAWAAYPKRSSGLDTDLTRDRGWEPLSDAGLRPVRQVSLDSTWSALRFRRLEHVKP